MQLKKLKNVTNDALRAIKTNKLLLTFIIIVAHALLPQTSCAQEKNTIEDIVIGYGTVKKINLTGAVTEVNVNDLTKGPVYSFTEALSGRAAGLQVSAADGQPGSEMNMLIRNFNSLFQNNAPLFVIDGTIVPNFQAAALNPNDIETINILKDAAATAIYGANSANGVVLIQTKRGQVGKPVFTFNNAVGFQQVTNKMELMSPYEFVAYQQELDPVDAGIKYFINGKTLASYRDMEGIDWQDLITRRSLVRMHNLSLKGGSEKTKYAFSASNFQQDGVIANSNAKRYQVRVAVDQEITDQLTVGITANYSNLSNSGQIIANSNLFTLDLNTRVWGYRPVTGSDFDLVNSETDIEVPKYANRINPVLSNKEEDRKNEIADLLMTAYLNYKITKDLTWRSTGSYINRKHERSELNNLKSFLGASLAALSSSYGNFGSAVNDKREYWMNDHTLAYEKNIAENHQLSMMGGFALRSEKRKADSTYATQIPTGKTAFDIGIPNFFEEPIGRDFYRNSLENKYKFTSFFGRLFYGYKSKYLVEGIYRADKSKDDYGLPSIDHHHYAGALAWNMHEEHFLKNFSAVSASKIRMSYGKGKDRYQNADQVNIGYDLGLFNNRLALTVDVYKKTIENRYQYYVSPFPNGIGLENIVIMRPWDMVSDKLQNKGLEFNLNTINVTTASFSWQTNFNINFNKNKVLQLEGNKDVYRVYSGVNFLLNSNLFEARVGQSAGAINGLTFDGVYQYADFNKSSSGTYTLKNNVPFHSRVVEETQPGDIKFKDVNGDGVVNAADESVIGRGLPVHTGGFTNNFTYKNFDIHVFFQWSYGNDIYNANRVFMEGHSSQPGFNQFASYVNRWTPQNPTNENFRAGAREDYYSSRVVEDGSYLRLKTASLAYNVPINNINKLNLSKLQLHITAQNLLTFTKYSGMDPEVSLLNNVLSPGVDMSAYPQARTLMFGINASF